MSDVIKINEVGRSFYALFDDVSTISDCKLYMKAIPDGPEAELSPVSPFSGELDGQTVQGYRYIFKTGDFPAIGNYSIETYIETTGGYKGRREATVIQVHSNHEGVLTGR